MRRLQLLAPAYDTDVVLPVVVSKEARVRLDTNSWSVPPEYAGKTVHLSADDVTVRVLHEGTEVARLPAAGRATAPSMTPLTSRGFSSAARPH